MRKTIFALVASALIVATPASAQIYVQPGSDTPGVVECGMADADGSVNCSFRETSDPFAVTDTQIAGCVEVVFAKNRMTERTARQLRAGAEVVVLGERRTLDAGDTLWGVCDDDLRLRASIARDREWMERFASLMQRFNELGQEIRDANATYFRLLDAYRLIIGG